MHIQIAQGMTRIMPGDAPAKLRPDILYFKDVDKEGTELVRARGQRFGASSPALIIREEFVKVMHHCRAGARRADDRLAPRLFKDFYEALGQRTRFPSVSGIEGGLPATGLPLVEDDFASGPAQHLDRARAD
jgi:hypothetical protein